MINSSHLESWLGASLIKRLQHDIKGWYGGPINIADVPGNVSITPDGDFAGKYTGPATVSLQESLYNKLKELDRRSRRALHLASILGNPRLSKQLGMAGFTSFSDLMSEATVAGKVQPLGFSKTGTTGVIGGSTSLWAVGSSPPAGAASAALPGGTIPTNATTGALQVQNATGGDFNFITGADVTCNAVGNTLLAYDRLWSGVVTPNTTTPQAITGVPTRYQNTTAGLADSINGNFAFLEVGTVLAATAHNVQWTYLDQNNAAQTGQVSAGVSGAVANRLDQSNGWFMPPAASTTGIKALTQITMATAVATGTLNAVVGHPLAFMALPLANIVTPFDWVWQRFAPSRVADNACVAFLELNKPSTSATTYVGNIIIPRG